MNRTCDVALHQVLCPSILGKLVGDAIEGGLLATEYSSPCPGVFKTASSDSMYWSHQFLLCRRLLQSQCCCRLLRPLWRWEVRFLTALKFFHASWFLQSWLQTWKTSSGSSELEPSDIAWFYFHLKISPGSAIVLIERPPGRSGKEISSVDWQVLDGIHALRVMNDRDGVTRLPHHAWWQQLLTLFS
jgi:hypothetical protein